MERPEGVVKCDLASAVTSGDPNKGNDSIFIRKKKKKKGKKTKKDPTTTFCKAPSQLLLYVVKKVKL